MVKSIIKFSSLFVYATSEIKMKYLLVLSALCALTLGQDLTAYAKKVMEKIMETGAECAEKLGATPEDMEQLMKHQVPESKAGQCVVSCVNKEFGLQTSDGKINKSGKIATMEGVKDIDVDIYNKMSSVWDTCAANAAEVSDECDTGLNLMKCMKQEREKLGLKKEQIGI